MGKKKSDRMKERKGPKSCLAGQLRPLICTESRQQVGRLSRLRCTAWAALSQQLIKEAFTLCLLLMNVSEITKGTSSSAAERKQSFRTTCSRSSALSTAIRRTPSPPTPLHTSMEGGDERLFFCVLLLCFFFLILRCVGAPPLSPPARPSKPPRV